MKILSTNFISESLVTSRLHYNSSPSHLYLSIPAKLAKIYSYGIFLDYSQKYLKLISEILVHFKIALGLLFPKHILRLLRMHIHHVPQSNFSLWKIMKYANTGMKFLPVNNTLLIIQGVFWKKEAKV